MANGSRHAAWYIKEVTYGVTPATTPAFLALRHNKFDLGVDKDTLSSAEIRADRNITDFRMGQNKAGGSFEMYSLNDAGLEDFLAAALDADWATNVLKNGTTRSSFSILRNFGDLGAGNSPYHLYNGCEVAGFDLKVGTNSLATFNFEIINRGFSTAEAAPTGATLGTASTTAPMDAFTGVVEEGGSTIAVVTEFSLKVTNNLDRRFVIGSKDTLRPSEGRFVCTGEIGAYFESGALYNKFINDTASSLKVTLTEGASTLEIFVPNIKYTGARLPVNDDGPIMLKMPFQAVYHAGSSCTLQLKRSA